MTNNSVERALRGLALARKAWLFAGSNRGGQRAVFLNSVIMTAKRTPTARTAETVLAGFVAA